ncbi:NAD(P)-binding protein [Nocardia sp. 2YAB30]
MTVVVVGSGHNALVAACYLARAGHAVEVLERDEVLGSAVSTVERFVGHRVDRGSSAHIMIRHTGIIAEVDSYAPGFADSVLHRHVQTPVDLERELGLIGGNVMHVEMSLDQMMLWRPLPELSGQRVPGAPGLYPTGASTHPGGGVSGASGRTAAACALRDPRRHRFSRWRGR